MSDVGKAWTGRAPPLAGGRPLPVPRTAMLLWLLLAAAAGLWWVSSDTPGEILSYHEDIVFLGVQHIELVGWAGGLAILALSMTVLGIGTVPSIFGLWAATLLPIVRNTYAGLRNVPTPLLEAARGMGMTPAQVFWRVELPNALFVIFGGIRTALSICVGTAPLAFLIGAGGLGELIFTGIALNDLPMMLAGAIPTALLAILTDFLVGRLQVHLVPRGINPLR
ncbi:MAG TPA: ABC transporter permease [Inquilinus sp.]|nr:ABC transporter permease [Inquilinus sp.]